MRRNYCAIDKIGWKGSTDTYSKPQKRKALSVVLKCCQVNECQFVFMILFAYKKLLTAVFTFSYSTLFDFFLINPKTFERLCREFGHLFVANDVRQKLSKNLIILSGLRASKVRERLLTIPLSWYCLISDCYFTRISVNNSNKLRTKK